GANSAETAGPWAYPGPSGRQAHYLRGSAYSTLLSMSLFSLSRWERVRGFFPGLTALPLPRPLPGRGSKDLWHRQLSMPVDVVLYPLSKSHSTSCSRWRAVAGHVVKNLHLQVLHRPRSSEPVADL